jgi:hypothetical protein
MDTGQRISGDCACAAAAYEMIIEVVAAPKDAHFRAVSGQGGPLNSQGCDWLRRRPSGKP